MDRRWLWLIATLVACEIPLLILAHREDKGSNDLLKKEEALSAEIEKGHKLQEAQWSKQIYSSREGDQVRSQLEVLQDQRNAIWQESHVHAVQGSAYLRSSTLLQFIALGALLLSTKQVRKQKKLALS